MVRVRRSVWEHGNDWNDTLLWYATGVREVQKRTFDQRTSWRFLAAIHGVNRPDWVDFGYLSQGDPVPSQGDQTTFFNKCQHGSWYFLPWHRGYLSAFERIIRDAIVAEGGPDDWALPYWNYNDDTQPDPRTIPAPFTDPTMPDGSPNALFTPYRFGDRSNGGALTIPSNFVALDALAEPQFAPNVQLPGGFGGGEWAVDHSGGAIGMLERVPHGPVHSVIGGQGLVGSTWKRGLMGAFETAGLDPIFWLHHCNIDRLWEVWLQRDASHENPAKPAWLGGPSNRPFVMPDPQGGEWFFNCGDVIDTTAQPLEYIYDDISDPLATAQALAESLAPIGKVRSGRVVWENRETELISANDEAMKLDADGARLDISVPGELLRGSANRMMQESIAPTEVERYFLLLDNIHGADNSGLYEVFVDYGEPGQELPSGLPRELLVGTFSTFGISTPSEIEGAGDPGISLLFNITPVIERMGFDEVPDLDRLYVRLAPVSQSDQVEAPTIGRIALYREGN
jgi:tyrosinase